MAEARGRNFNFYFTPDRARTEVSIFLSSRAGPGPKFLSLLRAGPGRDYSHARRAKPEPEKSSPSRPLVRLQCSRESIESKKRCLQYIRKILQCFIVMSRRFPFYNPGLLRFIINYFNYHCE